MNSIIVFTVLPLFRAGKAIDAPIHWALPKLSL